MDTTTMSKPNDMKCKTLIVIFAVISLVFEVLSYIPSFMSYHEIHSGAFILKRVSFGFPPIGQCFFILFSLLAFCSFILYTVKFYREKRATFIVPVIFAVLSLTSLINVVAGVITNIEIAKLQAEGYIVYHNDVTTVPALIMFVLFAIAVVGALNGFSKKLLVIIPISIDLFCRFISTVAYRGELLRGIIDVIKDINVVDNIFFLVSFFAATIGAILFDISILLFVLNNTIPNILGKKTENEPQEATAEVNSKQDSTLWF